MLRRIVAATMIGALALTSGCAFHNPFAKKAEPVTYEAVVQSELSPEEKVDKLVANMSDADKVGQMMMRNLCSMNIEWVALSCSTATWRVRSR